MRSSGLITGLLAAIALAPCAAAEEIVRKDILFATNSAELSQPMRNIVGIWAEVTLNCGATAIVVAGHIDANESEGASMELSRGRAEAVRSGLVQNGVSSSMLQIELAGRTRPAVATDGGVPNASNRRAEIIISCRHSPG